MTVLSDKELAASARRELLEDILPFWRRRTVDERRGGFIGQMSNDLRVQEDAPKGLILNARILWTFSAAFAYTQDERDCALAQRAYEYLTHHFVDQTHGGYFWELDPNGAVLRRQEEDLRRGVLPLRPGRVLSRFRRSPGSRTGRAAFRTHRGSRP